MDELEKERHAIKYKRIAYQRSYARDYYITEDELGILKTILKDFDFLVHLSADEIHKQVYTCVVA